MSLERVVLDTNILVSALLSREGNPAKIYRMFVTRTLSLIYCKEILAEYKDVLYRTRLRIPKDDTDIIMAAILKYGESYEVKPSVIPMIDEDDRIFYDVAKYTGAFLITGNTKHYPNEAFILTPTAFLELRQ